MVTYSCCCKGGNNCNNPDYVSPSGPPPDLPIPIMCYEGYALNSIGFSKGHYDICYGDCGTISLSGSLGGVPINASFSTCDPVSMCKGIGVINDCTDIAISDTQASLRSCCCNTDRCNAPGNGPATPPPVMLCFLFGIFRRNECVMLEFRTTTATLSKEGL
jgi:hypothetical protein